MPNVNHDAAAACLIVLALTYSCQVPLEHEHKHRVITIGIVNYTSVGDDMFITAGSGDDVVGLVHLNLGDMLRIDTGSE